MATFDRLPLFEAQCRSYPGPVSAAFYLPLLYQPVGASHSSRRTVVGDPASQYRPIANHTEQLQTAINQLQEAFSRLESQPSACSAVLTLFTEQVADPALAALMPTNSLRNAAMLPVTTPLAAMVDVDLSVSRGLAALATNAKRVAELLRGSLRGRVLWVMPAWETNVDLPMPLANRIADVALEGDKALLRNLWQNTTLDTVEGVLAAQTHSGTGNTGSGHSTSSGEGVHSGGGLSGAAGDGSGAGGRRMRGSAAVHGLPQDQGHQGPEHRRHREHGKGLGHRPGDVAVLEGDGRRSERHLLAWKWPWQSTQPSFASGPLHPFDYKFTLQGHQATNYERFLREDKSYRVPYKTCYEPWYIAARDILQPYDERYRGWYGDKVSQVLYSSLVGYQFRVLPDVWIIHRPHRPVAGRTFLCNVTGASSRDVEALTESLWVRFLPHTKFQLYLYRARNMAYRMRRVAHLGLYQQQVGAQFQNCVSKLPWWQTKTK